MADVVLITGLSGAGRSGTAAVLEDLDFYVVDNLPTSLVPTIVQLAAHPGGGIDRLALVSGRNHVDLLPAVERLRSDGHLVRILFLDAKTSVLVQRYDASRRKHPLAAESEGLLEAIERERTILEPIRGAADLVIDTSDLNVHQLKERLIAAFSTASVTHLQVAIESFGFKYGLPLDADIVMDVRFLPNPHWDDELRPLTGHDQRVSAYVLESAEAGPFVDRLEVLLADLVPLYEAEGRSYLTIAIGCTGGRHRSVAITNELVRRFSARGITTRSSHRDVSV
ncbi:MAG TPA: RNase adapter RapZ [Ilumatobacter sp.]|nr:RNase adapter RapZ [Ilumatobacter sp.]